MFFLIKTRYIPYIELCVSDTDGWGVCRRRHPGSTEWSQGDGEEQPPGCHQHSHDPLVPHNPASRHPLQHPHQTGEHAENRSEETTLSHTTLPSSSDGSSLKACVNIWLTGSFKIRGVANQFARRPRGGHFVTMSAGNYGKSFAYASKHYGSKGKVVMPETAPVSRSILIQVRGHLLVHTDTFKSL